MKIQSVSIDSIMVDPANVRLHPERNMETIKASLARFGQQKPLVVDGDNIVRAGNGTLEAARALGWSDIKIIRTPLKGSEATAYAIADNRSSELAEWDDAALASTLKALQDEEFDLAAIGYTDDELEDLLSDLADDVLGNGIPPEDPGPQIDRADELQQKWGTQTGQLWLIPSKTASGEHRLLCGDSTKAEDVARACDGQVQMCVTSPPYWGLRDYGTATWEGGDPACDHAPRAQVASALSSRNGALRDKPSRDCKCGATRIDAQLGLEKTPEEFTARMVALFALVQSVLRDDGVAFVNLGDSYTGGTTGRNDKQDGGGLYDGRQAGWTGEETRGHSVPPGLKPKDLCGIPWRVAFALQADGWYLRSDIIWHKPNPMPESVTDRPTKAHEYVFLLSKRERYFFDQEAVREEAEYGRRSAFRSTSYENNLSVANGATKAAPVTVSGSDPSAGRNIRTVWTITPQPFKEAHFATFPVELAARCIAAGTSERGACPICSAPWEQVTETPFLGDGNPNGYAERLVKGNKMRMSGDQLAAWKALNPAKQLGWRPTCSHDAEPQPCTVFDPFMGAATTIVACEQLGRLGRGIELSPAYVAIALERLAGLGLTPTLSTCKQVNEQVS